MDAKKLDRMRAAAAKRGAHRAATSSARMEIVLAKRKAIRRRETAARDTSALERLLELRAGNMPRFARNT
jgi:hypothetical protein